MEMKNETAKKCWIYQIDARPLALIESMEFDHLRK